MGFVEKQLSKNRIHNESFERSCGKSGHNFCQRPVKSKPLSITNKITIYSNWPLINIVRSSCLHNEPWFVQGNPDRSEVEVDEAVEGAAAAQDDQQGTRAQSRL